ncbi:MAG: hypothetical protein KGQ42_09290 [Alphaproteobacteria bacterium]|nr:hypothetical protein [Alphaproteobacteria bacterium]
MRTFAQRLPPEMHDKGFFVDASGKLPLGHDRVAADFIAHGWHQDLHARYRVILALSEHPAMMTLVSINGKQVAESSLPDPTPVSPVGWCHVIQAEFQITVIDTHSGQSIAAVHSAQRRCGSFSSHHIDILASVADQSLFTR